MSSLVEVARTLGVRKLLDLRKAKQVAWEDLISAHFVTRCFQTLLNLGLLREMSERPPVNVRAFAQANTLNADLIVAVCDALYSRGVLQNNGPDQYSLDERGAFLFDSHLSRGWFNLANGYEEAMYRLEDLLRGKVKYGHDFARHGELVAVGSGLASRDFYFPLVTAKIRSAGYRRVLDLGCGDGEFLRLMCEQIPGVQGVGLDLCVEAVAVGNQHSAELGMSERVVLHAGDALRLPMYREKFSGVDAATTFFVLHEFCGGKHEKAVAFLKAFRETLPGVPFLVIETIRPTPAEMRAKPGPAIEYFLFHDLSGQKPVGRDTWKQIFHEAGFETIEEDYIAFARTSIFTVR